MGSPGTYPVSMQSPEENSNQISVKGIGICLTWEMLPFHRAQSPDLFFQYDYCTWNKKQIILEDNNPDLKQKAFYSELLHSSFILTLYWVFSLYQNCAGCWESKDKYHLAPDILCIEQMQDLMISMLLWSNGAYAPVNLKTRGAWDFEKVHGGSDVWAGFWKEERGRPSRRRKQ